MSLFGTWNVIVEAAFFRFYKRMEKRCRPLHTNNGIGILSLPINERHRGTERPHSLSLTVRIKLTQA
jgi:hypothetical protein